MKKNSLILISFFVLLIITGCGGAGSVTTPSDPPPTPPVGGISVASPDGGATLSLDESSLPAGVTGNQIIVTKQTPLQVEGFSILLVYDFKPDGIVFTKPVTLTISLQGLDLAGTPVDDIKIAFIKDGNVEILETTKSADNASASAQITHFSIYGIVAEKKVDDPPGCVDGEEQSCGSDVGECMSGTQVCAGGAWDVCEGAIDSAAEECDGLDNDCDGEADEGCVGEEDLFLLLEGADDDRAEGENSVFPPATAQSFTVEALIYPTSSDIMYIASDDAYDLLVDTSNLSNTNILFALWQSDCATRQTSRFYRSVPLNLWTHISASYDASASELKVSINGSLEAKPTTFTGDFCSDPNYNFSVGNFYGGSPDTFSGKINEVRVSDAIRYTSNFTPSTPFITDANTKGLWHFDEITDSTSFIDSSGNGNTLTASGDARTGL